MEEQTLKAFWSRPKLIPVYDAGETIELPPAGVTSELPRW
jgi:hypothetical protein